MADKNRKNQAEFRSALIIPNEHRITSFSNTLTSGDSEALAPFSLIMVNAYC
jgi:hypothetical protein